MNKLERCRKTRQDKGAGGSYREIAQIFSGSR
jgi:hypothetical protein